jgi:hypothetical protein
MYQVSRALRCASGALTVVAALALAPPIAVPADAASSAGCEGGGFVIRGLNDRSTIGSDGKITIPADNLGPSLLIDGRYVEFAVVSETFAVEDWTLTGEPNPLDITGNRRTVVFDSKTPDHRGLILTSDVTVERKGTDIVLSRQGPGLTMKIQAKDCANGGIFQMEPDRADEAATVFTHVLGDGVFYFDNPNVRDRLGENIPCSGILPDGTPVVCKGANPDGTVTVTARVNFANDLSEQFVGRDSSQAAIRLAKGCPNSIPNPFHPGTVNHCGGVSQWIVASGGRVGQVMGEDATEIAPAATVCTANCTAQDRVQGKAVVVGFPFPVPNAVRLQPRFFSGFVLP